ncbi:MAG: hypothetical protein U0516_04640 [Candidatus Saccharibacteria bacterium]
MQKFYDNLLKLIFAVIGLVFLLAIVSSYFGYILLVAFIAGLVVAVGLLVRARRNDRTRIRDLQRDLDRARRWP